MYHELFAKIKVRVFNHSKINQIGYIWQKIAKLAIFGTENSQSGDSCDPDHPAWWNYINIDTFHHAEWTLV